MRPRRLHPRAHTHQDRHMRIHSLILGENFYEQKRDMAPRGGQTCGTPPPLLGSLNATLAFSDALINCAEHFRGEAWGAGDEGLARAGGKLVALPSAQTVMCGGFRKKEEVKLLGGG